MDNGSTARIAFPFMRDWLDLPHAGQKWLAAGAGPGFRLPDGFAADVIVVQGFRPWFLALAAQGRTVVPQMPMERDFDGALVSLGRHRGENERRLFHAALAVKPGGTIVIEGSKADGAASFARRLGQSVSFLEQASKHHGTVMWFRRPDDRATEHILPLPADLPPVGGRFRVSPGMFSSDHADPGSILLAGCLPKDLTGAAADFGAGWGYLAVHLAERNPGLGSIDLYEADLASLEAAKDNCAQLAAAKAFLWHDLTGEEVKRKYDVVVMNPPFHEGRAADPRIGQDFILAASGSLKPGGRLFMVANRRLPYEAVLEKRFRKYATLAEDGGYKAIMAVR